MNVKTMWPMWPLIMYAGLVGGVPSELELSELDGTIGFVIDAGEDDQELGESVDLVGDLNGDGRDDFIISAPSGNSSSLTEVGVTYVVYGREDAFPIPFDLSDINGVNGFKIYGVGEGDMSGASISYAGDLNADGVVDLVIGADRHDANGDVNVGASYVVFGKSSGGFPVSLHLSALDGTNGFVILGEEMNDRSGSSVSFAGDVNGDGMDDLIIGAPQASHLGESSAGMTYVLFGQSGGYPASFKLSHVDGTNGFKIGGDIASDRSGYSVGYAGDINGDGFDDVFIGAPGADRDGNSNTGAVYVVYGSDQIHSDPVKLANINGTNGFMVNGLVETGDMGEEVAHAGDINGDGTPDLIIGTRNAGASYVLFGNANGLISPFYPTELDGTNGFIMHGLDILGYSVDGAGDINGDGMDDLIVGAPFDFDIGDGEGFAFVVYGSTAAFPQFLDMSSISQPLGFTIRGTSEFDFVGTAVSAAGDVNGDGLDDILIGATGADIPAGKGYVIYGNDEIFLSDFE
jgi:hypothetical protein